MSYWAAGAAIGSAVIGSASANSASNAQQDAAGAANDLQRAQYGAAVERNQPHMTAGTDALAALQQKLPGLTSSYDPQNLLNEPGYQFGLQQGQQALERSLAARGRSVSGAALKAAAQYGTDYGTTKLNDAFSRDMQSKQQTYSQLYGLSRLGQNSANLTGAAGENYANQAGSNLIGAGNSAAANDRAQGNIWTGLINQGVSAYGRSGGYALDGLQSSFSNTGIGGSGYGTGLAYGNQDMGQYLADGGPVRSEPRVGTRTARSSGTVAGAVRGPGGPKDDAIDAHLSDGEHVFDAEAAGSRPSSSRMRQRSLRYPSPVRMP